MFENCYSLTVVVGSKTINNSVVAEKRGFLADVSSLDYKSFTDLKLTHIDLFVIDPNGDGEFIW